MSSLYLLKDTEKKANGQETSIVLHKGRQGHDDSPAEDNASHVPRRALEPVEDHVRGDFAEDKGDEEDGGDDVVLNTLEVQVICHSLDLCVTNVGLVEIGNEIQENQHGDQPPL
ncbi:hypothetical protein HG530_001578 [Fusarium avenaceum]|nr:hypothetical protein HG530_001578 [Fusarium avenaceum]